MTTQDIGNVNDEGSQGPPVSKADYVLRRLIGDISSGKVTPGTALRQADLAKRYGVSPTPVREALRSLEADGIIEYSPHRGATVADLSSQSMDDLYRLRVQIEGFATAVATERVDGPGLDDIRSIHRKIELEIASDAQVLDGAKLFRLNREFHFAIYSAGSKLIASHVDGIWRYFPEQLTVWSDPEIARHLFGQHAEILEAIEARDPELAQQRMMDHVHTGGSYRQEQFGRTNQR